MFPQGKTESALNMDISMIPFFVKYPNLYEFLTHFAGYLLKIHPQVYRLWIGFEKFKSKIRAKKTGILGEHPSFKEAATELSQRGFDFVIFGHTHHAGKFQLEGGSTYINSGSWMIGPHCVVIEPHFVNLCKWNGTQFELI